MFMVGQGESILKSNQLKKTNHKGIKPDKITYHGDQYCQIKNTDSGNFLSLGKITHAHGLKGEFFVSLFSHSGKDILPVIIGQSVQIRNIQINNTNKIKHEDHKAAKQPSGYSFRENNSIIRSSNRKQEDRTDSKANQEPLQTNQQHQEIKLNKSRKNKSPEKLHIEDTGTEFFVQTARLHKEGLIVQAKAVETRHQAKLLKGSFLFVPKQLFSSLKKEYIYLCEVLDFEVYDKNRGNLGKVFAFSDNGAQDLLLVCNMENKQVEIPFIKEFIIRIDFDLEKIKVHLPNNWPGFL